MPRCAHPAFTSPFRSSTKDRHRLGEEPHGLLAAVYLYGIGAKVAQTLSLTDAISNGASVAETLDRPAPLPESRQHLDRSYRSDARRLRPTAARPPLESLSGFCCGLQGVCIPGWSFALCKIASTNRQHLARSPRSSPSRIGLLGTVQPPHLDVPVSVRHSARSERQTDAIRGRRTDYRLSECGKAAFRFDERRDCRFRSHHHSSGRPE